MFAKIVILCAAFAATSANLVGTGTSAGSRVMDGHGNYAFQYGIASAGAKRSRSEVGSGYAGPIKTSYSVADSHIAPAAPLVAHGAAPVVAAAPLGYAGVAGLGGLGYGAGLGHGYGAGLGYGAGYGYGAGLGYGAGYGHGLGYGAGALGHGLGYGAGYGAGYGYGGVGLLGAGKLY